MVVREIADENGMSSYPMMETSSGIRSPLCSKACFAPKAMMSLVANTNY